MFVPRLSTPATNPMATISLTRRAKRLMLIVPLNSPPRGSPPRGNVPVAGKVRTACARARCAAAGTDGIADVSTTTKPRLVRTGMFIDHLLERIRSGLTGRGIGNHHAAPFRRTTRSRPAVRLRRRCATRGVSRGSPLELSSRSATRARRTLHRYITVLKRFPTGRRALSHGHVCQ